jgi:hypothetical protein
VSVVITSTTDTKEQIEAAMAHQPGAKKEPETKPAETPAEKPAETPAAATPETKPAAEPEAKPDESAKADKVPTAEEISEAARTLNKGKSRTQLRFDELTRQRHAAERKANEEKARAEAETARAEALARELEAIRAAKAKSATETPAPATQSADEFKETRPEPKEEDFESYALYTKEVAKWAVEQERARTEHVAAKAKAEAEKTAAAAERKAREDAQAKEAEERAVAFSSQVEQVRAKYEDFETVMEAASAVQFPVQIEAAIQDSDVGGEVLYYLAKNKAIAEDLAKLPLGRAIKRIGQIEAKVEEELAKAESGTQETVVDNDPPVPAKKVPKSDAPEPMPQVRASATTTGKAPLGEVDFQEFKRRRAAGER